MRCNPLRWLWGLLPLLILGWLTVKIEHPRIEADLASRTQAALKAAGLEWGTTTFSGRDGTISGRALRESQPALAQATVRDVWGVRVADEAIELLDKVEAYVWSAQMAAKSIVLEGYVPDDAARASVLALVATKFPGASVDDRMKLARGAPETGKWLAAVGFALDKLGQLKSGTATLTSLDLGLTGEAKSFSSYKAIKASLRNALPEAVRISSDKVSPPVIAPYTWSAKRSATELVLSGHVPSEVVHNQIFEYAKAQFPKLVIIDRLEIAAGAEEGTGPAFRVVLAELAQLVTGEAKASALAVAVEGQAPDQVASERIQAQLRANMPAPFTVTSNITYPKPEPPVVSPYITGVEMVGADAVRVSGSVPSEDDRTSLLQRIGKRLEGRRVIDALSLGSGPAEGWQSCVLAGVDGLKRLGNGSAVLTDRSLVVMGRTDDEVLADLLPKELRAAGNRSCDSTVEIVLDLPPEPNLTWRAIHDGDGEITLEGDVLDAAAQAELTTAAQKAFPNARVNDRMTIAGGKSRKWTSVASAGVTLLAKLRKGRATLSGLDLVIAGEAKDTSVAAAVKDQLQHTLAKGYTGRDQVEVRSDAMIWSETEAKRKAEEEARRQAEGEAARLSAAAEARRTAEAEAAAQREAAARLRAEDEARVAAERARLAQLEAQARQAQEAARASSTSAPASPERVALEAEADRCEALIRDAAAAGVVQFQFASAELDEASHETLNKLAAIARSCPTFRIIIEGHTDSDGDPDRNQRLSEARAQSVVQYLQSAGLEAGRLSAVGYGETRPVADNETTASRAKNRRIEFSVTVE
ncbi:MAG: OmpA family protein [Hyphomicrobiaceae bacterium]|nr:OmpA family protein [Hyphomicrobiaceae bacterium]